MSLLSCRADCSVVCSLPSKLQTKTWQEKVTTDESAYKLNMPCNRTFRLKTIFLALKAFCNGDDIKFYTNYMEVSKTQPFANSITNNK